MNRRILFQVTAPTVIIGGLLFVVCVVSAWYISRLQGDLAQIRSQRVVSLEAAQELQIRVRQLRFHSFLNLIDPKHPRSAGIVKAQRDFEKALERVRSVATDEQERAYIHAIAEGYERYQKELAELSSELAHGTPPADFHKVADAHPVNQIVEPCEALLVFNNRAMDETTQEGERVSHLVTIAMVLLGLVGPVSGLVGGYGIARALSRTIYQLSVRVHGVAQRLDQTVGSLTVPADGDLRSLDSQLQEVVHRVEEVMNSWQKQRRDMLRAEQLSAVGQLAASVAHEVRNPLTGVKLLVDAALSPIKPRPLSTQDLQVIRDEVARVERTVRDFLDFARPPVPQCQTCDLCEVAKQAIDLMRARARQQGVDIDLVRDNKPVLASVDRNLLCTVFVNLFINSLDAMAQGGRLQAAVNARTGSTAQIEITDTGSGIAPEILGRLFTPFASSKATGTGLGLSISRRLVEEHGGTITGGNRPEGGAAFFNSASARRGRTGSMPTLLIVDDEQSVRYSFRTVLENEDVKVLTAATATEGLTQIREKRPDVVLLDIQLPDRSGLDLFREVHSLDPKRPVIFMTAYGTAETAIEAMKAGAFDYLIKPVDLEKVSHLLQRAFEAARLMHVPAELPAEPSADHIVGHSPIMQETCKAIGRLAPQDVNVLIVGESGTGKELVGRALYHHSKRAGQPFLAINCAAIPETLLESELFGHEQGAFTGATRRRIGKFEQVSAGTLFLDEIGDMAPPLQAKMLRVLQEQRFERVGGNETVQTHVRILAATNQDLEKLVAEGRFRKDLYYRLKVVTIQVPPLRDHMDDVPELAYYFLFRFDQELGLDIRGIAPDAVELLQSYAWPGNVRELQSVIKEAMLRASGHTLLAEFLPEHLRRACAPTVLPAAQPSGTIDLGRHLEELLQSGGGQLYDKLTEAMDRVVLPRILRHTRGNQTQASELLGLHRSTLRHKLKALGLAVDKALVDEATRDDS